MNDHQTPIEQNGDKAHEQVFACGDTIEFPETGARATVVEIGTIAPTENGFDDGDVVLLGDDGIAGVTTGLALTVKVGFGTARHFPADDPLGHLPKRADVSSSRHRRRAYRDARGPWLADRARQAGLRPTEPKRA